MMLNLKKCLVCMAIDRRFVYMAEGAADLPDPATSDKAVDPPADATEGLAKEGDKADKIAEAKDDRDEKKKGVKDAAADAVTDVKASVEPVKKVLNRLKGIIDESPEDIRYAIYTYRAGQYDRPRDRTGKAKNIMSKLIRAINTKKLDRDLVFQGGVDASKFNLGKVQGLPDSWHQAKVNAFKELLNVSIKPDASKQLRDDNKAIIQGYIDCEDKAARDLYLKNNEAVFCNQFGLLNLATAYQRAQNLGKGFPDAKPAAFQLDFNSKQGERFRTSAIDIGIKVEGKKLDPVEPPAPAPELPKPAAPEPAPKGNSEVEKKAIETSYKTLEQRVAELGKKLEINFYLSRPNAAVANPTEYAAYCTLLISKLGALETVFNQLDSDTKKVFTILHPTILNRDGEIIGTGKDKNLTFALDITQTPSLMKKRLEHMAGKEFKAYIDRYLAGTYAAHLYSDETYDLVQVWENMDKLKDAYTFVKSELAEIDKKQGTTTRTLFSKLEVYINPTSMSTQSEGYNASRNVLTIDITESVGGKTMGVYTDIVRDLIEGTKDAYKAGKR